MNDSTIMSKHRFTLLLVITFAASRLLFFFMGVRFDASGIDWHWQYLDIELLKSNLLRSVFYQHSQPPLFNLFLGTALKLFPNGYAWVLGLTFKALSLMLYLALFRILTLLRLKPWIAFAAATLFILSPGAVLYENWLFYTWPAAALLAGAALHLLRYEKERTLRHALLYLTGITAVCLMRSMFHLIYLIAAIIPLLFIASPFRKRIGVAAGISLLLLGSVFLKNLLLFGFAGSSSWIGMNLWKVAPTGGKQEQLAGSPATRPEPFSPITDYPETFQAVPKPYSDIPALADAFKQNGKPNLNHFGYIAVSDAYKAKALELIRSDPFGYAGIVLKAWGKYCTPAHSYILLPEQNRTALKRWTSLYSVADARLLVPTGLLLVLWGMIRSFVTASAEPGKGLQLSAPAHSVRPSSTFLFCAGTVFYVALIGNALEYGENMRFRVQTDPLLYIASLYVLHTLCSKTGKRCPGNEKV